MTCKCENKTIYIKRSPSITYDLADFHKIKEKALALERFAKLVYDNRDAITTEMIEEFYKANGLDHDE
jgi:hypothetical protein